MSFKKKKNAWKGPSRELRVRESVRMEMHRILSEIEKRGEQDYNLDVVRNTAEEIGDKELIQRIDAIKRRMRK